jgi:hypothetical protein
VSDASRIQEILQRYIENPPEQEYDCDGENYKHQLWDVARQMKDVPSIASLPGYAVVPIIEKALKRSGHDWTSLGYDSSAGAIDALEGVWDKAQLGMNEAPLSAAVRRAKAAPVTFRTKRVSTLYQAFLNIAYQLQIMRGDDFIVLPVEPLAKILGVSPMRISDYRAYAKTDGFLHEDASYCWNGAGKGVATKFHFRWDGK